MRHRIEKTFAQFLRFLLVMAICTSYELSFAKRILKVPFFPMDAIHVAVQNVSSIPQTVQVQFSGSPGFTVTGGTCGGSTSTTCINNVCSTHDSLKTILPGAFLRICGRTNGNRVDTEIGYGGEIKIEIDEDRGAMLAVYLNYSPLGHWEVPINGGRPF